MVTILFDKDLICENCGEVIRKILDEMNEEYFDFVIEESSAVFFINKGNAQEVVKNIHDAIIY